MIHVYDCDGYQYGTDGLGTLGFIYVNSDCDVIEIPNETPDSEKITVVGPSVFHGEKECHRLVLPSSVSTVSSQAFIRASIGEVVWPSNCCCIPYKCFYESQIQYINNIDHVREVGDLAFAYSQIMNICWPSFSNKIPYKCFFSSHLEEVHNIDHVESVELAAFAYAPFIKKLDFSNALSCIFSSQAFNGIDPHKVTLPYYSSFNEETILNIFHG